MKQDAAKARGKGAVVFTDMRSGEGVEDIVNFLKDLGGLK